MIDKRESPSTQAMRLNDNTLFGVLADSRTRVRLGRPSAKAACRLDREIAKIRNLIDACTRGEVDSSGQLVFSVADTELLQEALSACITPNNETSAPIAGRFKQLPCKQPTRVRFPLGAPTLQRFDVATTPVFITFTGVDEHTDPESLASLSKDYPVEFGILFSKSKQGVDPRYPRISKMIAYIRDIPNVSWSAHMCGDTALRICNTAKSEHKPIMSFFRRVQVNGATPDELACRNILKFAQENGVRPIIQCRNSFRPQPAFDLLHDCSAGTGTFTDSWPPALSDNLCGYAGGISADNVVFVLERIRESGNVNRYWLDMESSIRNNSDRFDLDKCRRVCEAVYGSPMTSHNRAPIFA